MGSHSLFWTDVRIEQLKKLHAEGYSAKDIGMKIGCSRNAVIGKSHRLGLFVEPKLKQAKQAAERKPIIRIVRMNGNSDKMRVLQSVTGTPYACIPVAVIPLNKTLMELEAGECRQPYGDQDYVFCGHPVRNGSSYCETHHRKNWVDPLPPRPRYVREAA